jgi:ATP-dependent exoDNAse (exonuclease V) beta subunit
VEKQKQFEAGAGNSLYMKRNFRSSDMVLDAVNDQFSLAMTLENSQLNYTDGSFMEKNEQYKEADGTVHKGIVNIHIMPEEKAKKEEIARGVYSVKENATTKKNKKTPNLYG